MSTSVALGMLTCLSAGGEELTAWPVDPHVKVFRDTLPPETSGGVKLRAGRNEYEPAQVAFRASRPLKGARIEITPLVHADGGATIGAEATRWNFVGFIPLQKNTPRSEKLQVRAAPCEVPDPLLEARAIDVPPDATQPVWITVRVPDDAVPGRYHGQVAVVAGGRRVSLPVELRVDPFALPDERHLLVEKTARVKERLGEAAAFVDQRRRALELCRRVVPGIADTEKDPARIMAVRSQIADEIIASEQAPLLLAQTEPAAGSTLVDGPIVVELRGAVEPGATVTVNGRSVEVRPDSTFACGCRPSGEENQIVIEAQRDGNKKAAVRRFHVRS